MAGQVCPKCGGVGWRIVEKDGLSGAERCECGAVKRAQQIIDRSGVPPLYRNASLENFVLPQDNPVAYNAMTTAFMAVRSYAREFPLTPKPGLVLVGDPGTGKTHLAVAALRMLMARGFEGLFFDYQNLLDTIRSGFDKASQSIDKQAYQSVLDAEILLLDDLGAHRTTDWTEDTVTSIITYRCNNNKPLIATTNLPDADAGGHDRTPGMAGRVTLAERIGLRARSRLFEMCKIIKMPAVEDYRIRKKG